MINRLDNTVPDQASARVEREAETVARRALGIALNSMWSDDPRPSVRSPSIVSCDPEVMQRAMIVLQQRVPPGRELSMALDLLRSSAEQTA